MTAAPTEEMHFLADDGATARLGAGLAATLAPGDLVLLRGGLGAGKTALARAIIRTLMNDPALEVPSPSFSLVQPYESNGIALLHADLYRLADAGEIVELGLFDAPQSIVLVEWPERSPALAARATLSIRLTIPHAGVGRDAVIEHGPATPA